MMIRVNGEYLDFNSDIEIEEQIKLFKDIETANGDYSYSFELSKTNKNLKALGLPFPDTIKRIYNNVPCELVDETGLITRTGSLQVTGITDIITASFFGGNNDWFSLLNEPLSSLNSLNKYDIDFTTANIMASWLKDSGLVFPLIDTGVLINRRTPDLKIEDFTGCFYVKTLFKEIFNAQGIKIEGDLLNDSTFNKLIVTSNARSQEEVEARSSYVQKTSTQIISGASALVTLTNETVFPFFDGSKNNYNTATSQYTADIKMVVDVTFTIRANSTGSGFGTVRRNGSAQGVVQFGSTGGGTLNVENLPLNAGDIIDFGITPIAISDTVTVLEGTSVRITPRFLYRTYGKSTVPKWTQGQLVSNVIRVFNVLPYYNPTSRTLTLNLFNQMKEKPPIDVSEAISNMAVDFSEFISSYAQENTFAYQEGDEEDLREYNISNFIKYGTGVLSVDNEFIEETAEVLTSDFTSPITYLNGVFDASLERIKYVEYEEIDDMTITSVTDSSGTPRFQITDADELFNTGDIVGIETEVQAYNGEWIVNTVTSSYITVTGLVYESTATGTATLLEHQFTTEDQVYMFINVNNMNNLLFSSRSTMRLENTNFSSCSLAFFNLLSNGREINAKYKQSLSFGSVNNPLSYQKSLLDTYWPIFSQILNDPVMIKGNAYFTRVKYEQLKTFLRPLRLSTVDTNNLYYLNRIRGYKNSSKPCYVELIKL